MEQFLKDNRCLCEIERPYLKDTFAQYGLSNQINNYKVVRSILLDEYDSNDDDSGESYEVLERMAYSLYGLLHARFILTKNGLMRMRKMFEAGH